MNKFKLIIFDWDGTLMDSTDLIASCVQKAFADCHLPIPTITQAKSIIGLALAEAINVLYPKANQQLTNKLALSYRKHFFSTQQTQEHLFPEVLSTLNQLKAHNIKLAVATGKARIGLDKDLKATKLDSFFDATRAADETKSKPDPLMLNEILQQLEIDACNSLMVGDSEYDLKMANNCNMPSVAVSYGAHSVERLIPFKPLKIIDNIQGLLSF